MNTKEEKLRAFERILDILDELREKCPWDRKQTLQSLRHLTLEEVYELSDSLLEENMEEIKKEIGDVFLHLIFYAKIASEKGIFDIADILNALCEKLIFRHPHIYGDVIAEDEDAVKQNWEKLKLKEGNQSVLEGVPNSLPSMVKAFRIQDKVNGLGFDFPNPEEAWKKVEEELKEFQAEIEIGGREKQESELGDVFFSLINYARILGINADTALERTNLKFISRFKKMEYLAKERNLNLSEMSLDEMDNLWTESNILFFSVINDFYNFSSNPRKRKKGQENSNLVKDRMGSKENDV